MSRKPGPFTCPTPIIELSGVNPFFSNIRQNIELSSGITETIPIRLPEGITFDKSQIPAFMRELIKDDGGKMKLAEAFQVNNKSLIITHQIIRQIIHQINKILFIIYIKIGN